MTKRFVSGATVLRVHAICYYRDNNANWPGGWREVDFKAQELIDALKLDEVPVVRGIYEFPVAGEAGAISNTAEGKKAALQLVAQSLLRLMKAAGHDGATIVPIPSTSHTRPDADFVARRIAQAIEDRDPRFKCAPLLYFAKPLPKNSRGGRRTAAAIRVNLRSTNLGGLRKVVLLDDISTTGAHLKAAASYLFDKGITVTDAFVVARAARSPPENMFSVRTIDLRF